MNPDPRAPSTPLRSRDAFLGNPNCLTNLPASPDAEFILDAYLKANCAGMRYESNAQQVLRALNAEPNLESGEYLVIRWLLGSIRTWEVRKLITLCGVSIFNLSEHVRAHGTKRTGLTAFLNQFAEGE